MVILIGGASGSGKTTMAQKLMEMYHIPYLSIDHIKMGMIRSNPTCCFSCNDPEDKIAKNVWPMIKEIIKTNIENDQNIIIEGCYLPTDDIMNFDEAYQPFIIPLYIGFSQEYIRKHYEDSIIFHRCETEHKDIDQFLKKDYFLYANNRQKARCERDHLTFFEINEKYDQEIENAYTWVKNEIVSKKELRYNK